MNRISVDFTQKLGPIRPMHSVNNGPAGSLRSGVCNDDAFREAGIPFARNHDASFFTGYGGEYTVDVHRIFRNFDADENLPESYDFLMTDEYVKRTFDCGTKVFYRLGARIEHEPRKVGTVPPKDFAKWARICEHIIRHYTEGWADGFTFDLEYWEIWNEPDCRNADGSNPCWQGTAEQFAEMYGITAEHLKKCFPNLKIGGPAFTGIWPENKDQQAFYAYIKEKHPPMDFFSFHCYGREPEWLGEMVRRARAVCKECGYENAELILNEWNYVRGWRNEEWEYTIKAENGLKGASFIASCMCVGQDNALDHLMYYDARPGQMNGMFETYTYRRKKGYYPFRMFNKLYRLGTQVSCLADEGLYANAAIGENGGAILLSHYNENDDTPEKTVSVSLSGFPAAKGYKVSAYLLDADHDEELTRVEYFTASRAEILLKMPLFTTYLLQIEPLKAEDFA